MQLSEEELDNLGDDGLYHTEGIRDYSNPVATRNLETIMNAFDYDSIRSKDTIKCVVRQLERQLVSYLETLLSPEKQQWVEFLNTITKMIPIPMADLQKAESITDVMKLINVQPYYYLMMSIRKVDSQYSTPVDPLYNTIVKLERRLPVATKRSGPEMEHENRGEKRMRRLSMTDP